MIFFVKLKLVSTVWVSTSLSKSGYSRGLPTLKEKGHKNKVPEWLGRNDNPYNHHKTIASRLEWVIGMSWIDLKVKRRQP